MAAQQVDLVRDGPVLTITLNNERTRNSLTTELREELGAAVKLAARDRTIRSVFLTGAGSTFCAGGDFYMLQKACDPWSVHRRFSSLKDWLIPLLLLEKPLVVGVNGHAAGGGMGLALSGDVIIASESAKFMAAFFRLGAVPDIGMMYQLPRLIGMARTKNFLFGNQTWSAQQALEFGLVAQVAPDNELREVGLKEARRLADGPAEVMGLAKQLLARSFENSMHEMFAFEGLGQALAMSNPEFREGLSAAIEKRKPDFAKAMKADIEASK
jgi:2-(1,2-epoxy-1,2-dihydrophenyl)acetyl-CoA isomerase